MSPSSAIEAERLIRHLDRAQRLANTGSWEWDMLTDQIIWSPQIFRMFGLSAEGFTPTYPAFLERVHPQDREMVEARVRRAVEGVEDYDLDHRIVLPDGTVRNVHEFGDVEYDAEGRAIRMLGAVQDVTDLRAAEAASRRNQEMLQSMLRISPEAIVVTDPAARILLFSAGAEAMFGYRAEEVVGVAIERLMPARYREEHHHHVERFAAGAQPSLRMHERAEIRGLRKSGEEFPAEASLAKLQTGDGFVFTTIVRDLSERKAVEHRLIEAREQAERANRAKSTFLANMSHEIRTPLNGVLGVAGALARTELSARQAEMVHLIETSGRALEGLLGDILDLAKVDAGRMIVRAEPFDLAAVVAETFALFRASAAEKGVSFRLDMDQAAHGRFQGDDLKIRQVLSNLLSNAVKFTERGAIRLSLTVTGKAAGAATVRMAVDDTGIGFDPNLATALFERFEQADGSITRRFGGTGLGLAISKSLVELMGGRIWATSTPGEGSRFAFELALPWAFAPRPQPAAPERAPASDRSEPFRILLAEDHAINRRAVEMILEPLPVELMCVENGQEALEASAAERFDLVFMDMQMPVMDGLTAIRRIREREAGAGGGQVPICVLTANSLPEHRAAAQAAGAEVFLTKPIDAQSLIDVVLEAAGGRLYAHAG